MFSQILEYDESLLRALHRVYGTRLQDFLHAITVPSRRLYVRVNTMKIDPGELIDRLRSRGIEVYRDEEIKEAVYFPVKGPYKVDILEKVVYADKYASESVYLGSDLYAPGVIDCSEDIDRGNEVTILTPTGIPIAIGVAEMSCSEMKRSRQGIAVKTIVSTYRAPKIRNLVEYRDGLIYSQSLPAMYVAKLIQPYERNDLVVDMCAAPGGKTGHVVELSRGRAYVIAFDHSKSKILEMKRELERLGHTPFVEVWRADSRYLHVDFPWLRPTKIILDPPCSALGVRPKLFDRKSYSDVVSASRYQWQFMKTAIKILRKHGLLVYSTCTVTIEENEAIVERAIEEFRCIEPIEIRCSRGSRGVWGFYRDYYLRFHPIEHDTTGYFIAILRKTCND